MIDVSYRKKFYIVQIHRGRCSGSFSGTLSHVLRACGFAQELVDVPGVFRIPSIITSPRSIAQGRLHLTRPCRRLRMFYHKYLALTNKGISTRRCSRA